MIGLRGDAEDAFWIANSRDRIRVAANALIVRNGEALLVEFSGGTARAHFNFPGGGLEIGETLEEGLQREVREETCLLVEPERLLLIVESVAARNTNTIGGERVPWNELRFFFLCKTQAGSPEARLPDIPDSNQTGVKWIALERLPNEPVLPQVCNELIESLETDRHPVVIPNPQR